MFWLILIGGIGFIIYTVFFGSGQKSKFKSDLPMDKVSWYKTKKGVVIFCLGILLTLFSVYLIVSFLI